MKILKAFFSLLVIGLLVIIALFVDFAYKTFSARPPAVQVDAIVVLVGGKGRVEEGVRLFRAGRANWLFLVGVDPTVRKTDLYRQRPGDPSPDQVILEKYHAIPWRMPCMAVTCSRQKGSAHSC